MPGPDALAARPRQRDLLPDRRDDRSRYVDDTGTGNTSHSTGRRCSGSRWTCFATGPRRPASTAFASISATRWAAARRRLRSGGAAPAGDRQDPVLREVKLIAEPWDVGPAATALGAFPAAWGEWNDRYRDTVRDFWRGAAGRSRDLATRLAGSADLFGRGRRPPRSINFVTAHDGFTLADLVSYDATQRGQRRGQPRRDG